MSTEAGQAAAAGRRRAGRTEWGMVTVELAAATLLVGGVVVGCVLMAGAAFTFARCQLVANEVARQEARGDAAAVAQASAEAPEGARVATRHQGGATVVLVRLEYRAGPATLPIEARATVLDEEG